MCHATSKNSSIARNADKKIERIFNYEKNGNLFVIKKSFEISKYSFLGQAYMSILKIKITAVTKVWGPV